MVFSTMAISTFNDFNDNKLERWTDLLIRPWLNGACFACRCLLASCFLLAYDWGHEESLLFERANLQGVIAWQASSQASINDGNETEGVTAVKKQMHGAIAVHICHSCYTFENTN